MKKNLLLLLLVSSFFTRGQVIKKHSREDLKNWLHSDLETDSIIGISTEKAYSFLKNKKSQTVIVWMSRSK